MSQRKTIILFACLIVLCLTQSGCQLLSLPGQIIGGVFGLLGKALQVADGLPKPPPGVFF